MKLLQDIRNKTSFSVDFLRSEKISVSLSRHGIWLRKIFAPILRLIYKTQTSYKIVIEDRAKLPSSKKGMIFAINHRQADDIVIGANVVGKSAYIVFGNPYLVYHTTNGLGLWAYGMILLLRDTPSSRHATYEKMKYVLEHGGNIIIYPEGYWNLDDNGQADACHAADGHNSENWLIQDINLGIIRLAKETGCRIVPTVLHYDETGKKQCYGMRGRPLSVTSSDDLFRKKAELVTEMQTMMYSMMEAHSSYHRADLEQQGPLSEQWAELKERLRSDCDIPQIGYHLDLQDEKRIGKAKVAAPVVTPQEAFAHLEDLHPCRENAFLFRHFSNSR